MIPILPIEKILSPNAETLNNPQKLKLENGFVSPILENEPHLNLSFVSDFVIRNSDFP